MTVLEEAQVELMFMCLTRPRRHSGVEGPSQGKGVSPRNDSRRAERSEIHLSEISQTSMGLVLGIRV